MSSGKTEESSDKTVDWIGEVSVQDVYLGSLWGLRAYE
jgi:hypothetical protein